MLDTNRIVIVNATPIISLSLIGKIDILNVLYEKILIPSAVESEVLAGGSTGVGISDLKRSDWIYVTHLEDPRRADLLSDLDRGEAEVIALALEKNADLVIIDERLARRHAKRLGLNLTGTLGVLLKAKQQKIIPLVSPLIKTLKKNGIRISDAVTAEAMRLAGES